MPNQHPTRPAADPAGTHAEQIRDAYGDALAWMHEDSLVAKVYDTRTNPARIGRPETFITGRPDLERIRTEGSVRRATAPRCYRLSRWRRWRWTVTRYCQISTTLPGVEGRIHVIADSGHTFTKLGAYIAAGRKLATR